jgi:hypothetical protein
MFFQFLRQLLSGVREKSPSPPGALSAAKLTVMNENL